MATLIRPTGRPFLPDVFDLFDAAWPFGDRHPVHIEEVTDKDGTLIRAELPGLDPSDIHVTTFDGRLAIAAERKETAQEGKRSEFRYGSFYREVALPAGIDTAGVTAKYRNGILEVRVPMVEKAEQKPVEVRIETGS
ncbi:Hsp20/alpha crystallin family protein [Fodinicola acaciae]|uniref:Hsp20/alpha crystallin family protein n=1 Tax=Fodinicola acaciae TaxID=2681555 RepID=UPI0013D4BCE3|nr:Hsp20/alpha crystallin family protein [Fodinicola acaciae]